MESLACGFATHLQVSLSDEEGVAFIEALGVNRMEDQPVVKIDCDKEVVDAEFESRD